MDESPIILAMLDVLGFEAIFRRHGLVSMHDLYGRLVEFIQKQTGGLTIVPVPNADGTVSPAVGWLSIEQAYFSDSVLFWAKYNPLHLSAFSSLIAEAICTSIELGLPVRGALSIGHAILDKPAGVYLGLPIIEAARAEASQKWIGASFAPSLCEPPYSQGMMLNTVLPYKSHIKPGCERYIPGMVVDWPRLWRQSRSVDIKAAIDALDTDPAYAAYYETTRRFVDFSAENHDWFKRQRSLDFG